MMLIGNVLLAEASVRFPAHIPAAALKLLAWGSGARVMCIVVGAHETQTHDK